MSDRYKILAAARKMQTFTAESLADYADVTRDNVYKIVLERDKRFFEKFDATRGKRGRPVSHFRVKPEAVDLLSHEVSSFQKDLGILRTTSQEQTDELTPDLLAAESYLLDQFPEAESAEEKAKILRDAIQHLNNDRQLSSLAAPSPRRKVDHALLKLSFDEFAVEQAGVFSSRAFGARTLYHRARASHILYDIVPELTSLPAEFQADIAARLKKSLLLSTVVAPIESVEEYLMPIAIHEAPVSIHSGGAYEIEFITPNRRDAALVHLADGLAKVVEPCGIHLDIRQYDEPLRGNTRPLMSIIACNSTDPTSPIPSDSELLCHADITYVADVGFRPDLRDRVVRSGGQYLSNIGSTDVDVLLSAMQPLPEVMNECRLFGEIAKKKHVDTRERIEKFQTKFAAGAFASMPTKTQKAKKGS